MFDSEFPLTGELCSSSSNLLPKSSKQFSSKMLEKMQDVFDLKKKIGRKIIRLF